MSIDEQSATNETRSLCARKEKIGKNNLPKKNSPRLLLLADLSFAIDAQHDKRSSLQDWYPGCNWTISRGTSLATCFFCSACRSTSNPQQTKRVLSVREREKEKIIPGDCCCSPTCRLRSARNTTSIVRCKTGTPVATGPYHEAQVLPPASSVLHVESIANEKSASNNSLREFFFGKLFFPFSLSRTEKTRFVCCGLLVVQHAEQKKQVARPVPRGMVQLQPGYQSCNELRLLCCAMIANDKSARHNSLGELVFGKLLFPVLIYRRE
jgi:hypothetical protein